MQTHNDDGRRGICVSLRRAGDVYEIAFDDVRLMDQAGGDGHWQPRKALMFHVLTPDEIEGNISTDRCAQFGMSVLDLLSYLKRYEVR
ncbi:MAG TPA: hypothetical protein VFT12_04265 [Thermoanaerobaculia bacterium]|nr:hypothetical protein [Thermoanaerobaculia bacterium]